MGGGRWLYSLGSKLNIIGAWRWPQPGRKQSDVARLEFAHCAWVCQRDFLEPSAVSSSIFYRAEDS